MIYYGLVITGTGTGVGKTQVACGIARAFTEKGIKVGVFKPVETGCPERNGELTPEDGLKLLDASGANLKLDQVAPYRFSLPASPYASAKKAGQEILFERIYQVFDELVGEFEVILVESAGGLLVPISENFLFADLVKPMALPILIVAENRLGVVNQVLLTIESARARELEVLGVVLNQTSPEPASPVLQNQEQIEQFGKVKVICKIGYLEKEKREKEMSRIFKEIAEELFLTIKQSGKKNLFKYL